MSQFQSRMTSLNLSKVDQTWTGEVLIQDRISSARIVHLVSVSGDTVKLQRITTQLTAEDYAAVEAEIKSLIEEADKLRLTGINVSE